MNKINLLFIVILAASCSTSKNITQIEPYNNKNFFIENGKPFAYHEKDSIIVSIAYDSYINHEYVFDLTIDNQTDSAIKFDPSQVYIFSYATDTSLSAEALFFAQKPDSVLLDLSKNIDSLDKKVQTSSIISVILGLAYITADIVMAGSDLPDFNRDLLSVAHLSTQIVMDETRMNKINEIDNLSYVRCRAEEDIYRTTSIQRGSFHSGKLHFAIPKASYYKVYVPVNDRIYSFQFKNKTSS